MQMQLNEFKESLIDLKSFMSELDRLHHALDMIAKGSVSEIGSKFIEDYITLLEKHVGDEGNWVTWYVFQNDFGKKGLTVEFTDKKKKRKANKMRVKSIKDLYKVIYEHRNYNIASV